ncbi:AGE family epimerase/isomerase [Pseudoalteromonas shioyasakiensis]|uniref:AGE family epimerase/isomerase n=1 Tax=Pseudoalteromonas shioyasakiensis TaxID=1190813 RepID=UPI002118D263|nr:AGE family epimerase/isomerase [Pseudoalteromonas shioyasakiensis]MCQ8877590.1 AGE family epimerase/isomerase [Pseudoalteromonas shioyasakiensis]
MTNNLYEYVDWLKQVAIPYWSTSCIDDKGASFEKILSDGRPDYESNRRVRVQTRQMFVFSAAQKMGWITNGFPLVAKLDQYIIKHAINPNTNQHVHLLNHEHQIINAHQDLYDVAFLLLAYGWRYHVFNDLNALNSANELLNQIDNQLKEHPGGWREGDYQSEYRRQNPHMHLFEAFLTLYKFTNNAKWLAKAGEIFCLFETCFVDHKQGVLFEYFSNDWKRLTGEKGNIIEPGHMMEWVWLLRQYQKYTQAPVDKICDTFYHNALKFGLDPRNELLLDEINIETNTSSGTKRCWPMTEWLKASLAQAEYTRCTDYNYLKDADFAAKGLLTHFIRSKEQGGYIDQLDIDNHIINHSAPASTLYHLVMAGVEIAPLIKEFTNAS